LTGDLSSYFFSESQQENPTTLLSAPFGNNHHRPFPYWLFERGISGVWSDFHFKIPYSENSMAAEPTAVHTTTIVMPIVSKEDGLYSPRAMYAKNHSRMVAAMYTILIIDLNVVSERIVSPSRKRS
jgi:hypothetical protein